MKKTYVTLAPSDLKMMIRSYYDHVHKPLNNFNKNKPAAMTDEAARSERVKYLKKIKKQLKPFEDLNVLFSDITGAKHKNIGPQRISIDLRLYNILQENSIYGFELASNAITAEKIAVGTITHAIDAKSTLANSQERIKPLTPARK